MSAIRPEDGGQLSDKGQLALSSRPGDWTSPPGCTSKWIHQETARQRFNTCGDSLFRNYLESKRRGAYFASILNFIHKGDIKIY